MDVTINEAIPKRGRLISIIVPVYKVGPYLRCCIDSILAQTFTDFEVILVDDGSPDACGAICDEYAQKDDRVVVIHTENQGVSAARNTGLDWVFANSDSQWITFVDSDDYIVPPYLEYLHREAVESGADIVTTHGYWFKEDSELRMAPLDIVSRRSMSGRDVCLSFYRDEELILPQVWGKLIKKDFLKELRFPVNISFAEDEELVVKLLYTSSRIVVLRSWLYGYRQRTTSAIQKKFSLWRYDKLAVYDSSLLFFQDRQENEIVSLIKKQRDKYAASCMLLAYGTKMTKEVPVQYRMPLWQAIWILFLDAVSRADLTYVLKKLQSFFRQSLRK